MRLSLSCAGVFFSLLVATLFCFLYEAKGKASISSLFLSSFLSVTFPASFFLFLFECHKFELAQLQKFKVQCCQICI
eukprot:m.183616 g.183616  ORF g.183616 m.183616 type:complete len:77 (+) comp21529_c2_seq3:479-709(+)